MRRYYRIIGIVLVVVIGGIGFLVAQRFTGIAAPPEDDVRQEVNALNPVPPKPSSDKNQPTAFPMEIGITTQPITIEKGPDLPPVPTAAPIEAAPVPAGLAAAQDADMVYQNDFESDIAGWSYDHVSWEPLAAPTWQRHEDGTFFPPANSRAMNPLNDMLALAPASFEGDGAVEVSALSRNASKVGLVMGYQEGGEGEDEQGASYVALVLSAEDGRGLGSPGMSLVQVEDGVATVLANDEDTVMQRDEWYQLRLEQEDDTITAYVDDASPLTAILPATIAGKVGLYAGVEGYAYFDNFHAWK